MIQVPRRLIRKKKRWANDDRPGNGHPLALPSTELVGKMIHTRAKAHLLQCFLGKFKSILLVIHFQGETHVFQSIEVGHQMKLLKDDTDVFRSELSQFFLGHRIQMAFFQF